MCGYIFKKCIKWDFYKGKKILQSKCKKTIGSS